MCRGCQRFRFWTAPSGKPWDGEYLCHGQDRHWRRFGDYRIHLIPPDCHRILEYVVMTEAAGDRAELVLEDWKTQPGGNTDLVDVDV
jgi:hypothetical protein